jgi:hypothetical protein
VELRARDTYQGVMLNILATEDSILIDCNDSVMFLLFFRGRS